MNHFKSISLAIFAAPLLFAGLGHAGQLRVEPVLLEMNAPAAAGMLTLRNDENSEATIQTRVLRWTQSAGRETIEPTADVVASPPAVKLAPHTDYVVRVVRVSRQPVSGEESYRVVVDQLPRPGGKGDRAVNLLIRQSIPVFFHGGDVAPPQVSWSIHSEAGKLVVVATNAGDERMRIANLRLRDSAGATVSFGNGLVGYVLGRSSMSWVGPNHPPGFGSAGSISVAAETDKGQIHAIVESLARR
jgi:fimbrial chaperone protein